VSKQAQLNQFIEENKDADLLGELVSWGGSGGVTHAAVVQALKDCGLDEKVAKEIMPKHAFTRAAKKMADEKIIEPVSEDKDYVRFQFTGKFLDGVGDDREIKYRKENVVVLDKVTGKIECRDKDLEQLAQRELDRSMAVRTTSDITQMVQKLFDGNGDLFPVRDQGGVYFVPEQFRDFTDRVNEFVKKTGGKMVRFPVPKNVKGSNESVGDIVEDGLKRVVNDLRTAIKEFNSKTQHRTFEQVAERIKHARFKGESYSAYLAGRKKELDDDLAEADRELQASVRQVAKDRKAEFDKKRLQSA
jgi:hypothetical protein